MFIQTEETPNPATLKFLPGHLLMKEGTAEFKSREEASVSPLAERLLSQEGVKGVFFGEDFITVSKDASYDWAVLKPAILGEIMEHFITQQPLFRGEKSEGHVENEDTPLVKEIKELLDTRVRPAVAMDGGDIVFDSFKDGILYVKLQGACAGCPSSSATLKSGIENMMRHYIPEVLEVRAINV